MINIFRVVDKLDPTFVSIVKALVLFFIPYLIGFIVASFSELRIWIALGRAIPTPPNETSGNTHRKWPNVIVVGLLLTSWILFCSLFITEYNLESNLPMGHRREPGPTILLSVICNGLFLITSKFVHQICGMNKMAVHRIPNGGYLRCLHDYRSSWGHSITRLLIIIASGLVVLDSTMTDDLFSIISVSIATMALVHLVSGSSFMKSPLLKIIECYVLILVAIASFIILNWLICQRKDRGCALPTFSRIWYRILFIPTALCSVFSGSFIARMLRFDYQRHLDESNGNEELDLVTVPAPAFNTFCYNKKDLVEGILIPQWAPRAFYKPYFAISLVVWSIAQITVFGLYVGIGFPVVSNLYVVCALALLLEFPVMVVVLLCFAAVRKETKTLWNYQESWRLSSAEGAISLPSDSSTS